MDTKWSTTRVTNNGSKRKATTHMKWKAAMDTKTNTACSGRLATLQTNTASGLMSRLMSQERHQNLAVSNRMSRFFSNQAYPNRLPFFVSSHADKSTQSINDHIQRRCISPLKLLHDLTNQFMFPLTYRLTSHECTTNNLLHVPSKSTKHSWRQDGRPSRPIVPQISSQPRSFSWTSLISSILGLLVWDSE